MERAECRDGQIARSFRVHRACVLVHPPLEGEGKGRFLAAEGGPGWGDAASPKMLKRCHPHPAAQRPTSPPPNLAVARVRPLYRVTEVGQARLRLGEVLSAAPRAPT